jgi:hypothetical protein
MSSITHEPTRDDSSRLDVHLVELIETVWACERAAQVEDRIDALVAAAARYLRPGQR